jgi:hypothetical protein
MGVMHMFQICRALQAKDIGLAQSHRPTTRTCQNEPHHIQLVPEPQLSEGLLLKQGLQLKFLIHLSPATSRCMINDAMFSRRTCHCFSPPILPYWRFPPSN